MSYPVSLSRSAIFAALCLGFAPWMRGSTVFNTPWDASDPGGNPISTTAVFQATSQTQLLITLTNNQANPRDDGQMLVAFSFRINQSLPGVALSSSGTPIDIESGGAWTYLSDEAPYTDSTYWDLTSNAGLSSTFFVFCDNPGLAGCSHRGADWPERGLIGPPDAQNRYSNANGSITTGAHEPVLSESASFLIDLPAGSRLSSDLQISDVTFAFGTLASPQTYTAALRETTAVPEAGPAWLIAGGLGLMLLGAIGRRRWTQKNSSGR